MGNFWRQAGGRRDRIWLGSRREPRACQNRCAWVMGLTPGIAARKRPADGPWLPSQGGSVLPSLPHILTDAAFRRLQ